MPSDLIRGWIPVRVKKTRQNKNLEPRPDSIGTEEALGRAFSGRHLGLLQDGKTDFEHGPPTVAGCRRDRSVMALHDGAADREPHAHSVSLHRMEGGKEIAGYLRINSGPSILDLQDGHLRVRILQ